MTDPIKIIKSDHTMIEALFKKYEGLGDDAFKTKQATATEIIELLSMHAEMEEKLFYPKLEEKFNKEDEKMVEEAYTEHSVAKKLMADIESAQVDDPQFDARVKVLTEMVRHHVKEEEGELLPEAQKELTEEEQDELGKKMEDFKENYGGIMEKMTNLL